VRSRRSELGKKLREQGASIGEVMTWLSALYFRGKLTYARRFGVTTDAHAGVLVMAPGRGLQLPETVVSPRELRAMGRAGVASRAFTRALERDARALHAACAPDARIVLLGSIATGKYTATLLEVFAERLLFPASFVGRGDMSRGGLLLRAAQSGEELEYIPIAGAKLHGTRPPKLPKLAPRDQPSTM
jgi:hypothetical protein